jgi:hypothetical protein
MKKLTKTEKSLIVEMNKNEVAKTLLNGHKKFLIRIHELSNDTSTKEVIDNHLTIMELWEEQLNKLYKIN